jgi:hypothetical protein
MRETFWRTTGMVHREALPVIRYPGLRPWAGAGSKMYFDIRDLDQFVEINKEYGYEELDSGYRRRGEANEGPPCRRNKPNHRNDGVVADGRG